MTLFGHLDTWLLIGVMILGVCGLMELHDAWVEWRERRRWDR